MSKCQAIETEQLSHVSGGAITARSAAPALDAIMPDQVGIQVGPFSASWNVPERPFTSMLDKVAPQPKASGKGNFWSNVASQAVAGARGR